MEKPESISNSISSSKSLINLFSKRRIHIKKEIEYNFGYNIDIDHRNLEIGHSIQRRYVDYGTADPQRTKAVCWLRDKRSTAYKGGALITGQPIHNTQRRYVDYGTADPQHTKAVRWLRDNRSTTHKGGMLIFQIPITISINNQSSFWIHVRYSNHIYIIIFGCFLASMHL